MIIGAHVSIKGGVQYAIGHAREIGCESFQIFTKNQRRWHNPPIKTHSANSFKHLKNEYFGNTAICAHASYLINLCAAETEKLNNSRLALADELNCCDMLAIDYLVIHPGSYTIKSMDWGIKTIIDSLNIVLLNQNYKTQILLETTAGQGSSIGHDFSQLAQIIKGVENKQCVGVCLDTCHVFAAGYQIAISAGLEDMFECFDCEIGLHHLKLFHLNDSKMRCGSKVDRHAAIGEGLIGKNSFERLINHPEFKNIPGIIEIPGDKDIYRDNISLLKGMRHL